MRRAVSRQRTHKTQTRTHEQKKERKNNYVSNKLFDKLFVLVPTYQLCESCESWGARCGADAANKCSSWPGSDFGDADDKNS